MVSNAFAMYTSIKSPGASLFFRFTQVTSALFIFLFVYSASSKLIQLQAFETVLSDSPLLGGFAKWTALIIPVVEIATTVLLFIPRTRKQGLVLSFVLMLMFSLYVAYMLLFFSHLPCSCGGFIQSLSWRQHLGLNLILTALAGVAVFHHKIFIAINRVNRKPVTE